MKSIKIVSTVDTQTAGASTRIITAGLYPPLAGDTMAEKMELFRTCCDNQRKFLLHEPRGHRDLAGAVITGSKQPGADLGIIFLTHSGYQSMCVTSTMGALTAAVEMGMLQEHRCNQRFVIETPAGLVNAQLQASIDGINEIRLQTAPAFLFEEGIEVTNPSGQCLRLDIAYSGAFFALLDAAQLGLSVSQPNSGLLQPLGLDFLEAANQSIRVFHPSFPDVNAIDMIMIYEWLSPYHARDIVISRSGGVDRSPCGAGTGALLSMCSAKGRLEIGEAVINESYIGSQLTGRIAATCQVGENRGVIPEITGRTFITGFHQFILEAGDPFPNGFET